MFVSVPRLPFYTIQEPGTTCLTHADIGLCKEQFDLCKMFFTFPQKFTAQEAAEQWSYHLSFTDSFGHLWIWKHRRYFFGYFIQMCMTDWAKDWFTSNHGKSWNSNFLLNKKAEEIVSMLTYCTQPYISLPNMLFFISCILAYNPPKKKQ